MCTDVYLGTLVIGVHSLFVIMWSLVSFLEIITEVYITSVKTMLILSGSLRIIPIVCFEARLSDDIVPTGKQGLLYVGHLLV